jgi:hypothetical protein
MKVTVLTGQEAEDYDKWKSERNDVKIGITMLVILLIPILIFAAHVVVSLLSSRPIL